MHLLLLLWKQKDPLDAKDFSLPPPVSFVKSNSLCTCQPDFWAGGGVGLLLLLLLLLQYAAEERNLEYNYDELRMNVTHTEFSNIFYCGKMLYTVNVGLRCWLVMEI